MIEKAIEKIKNEMEKNKNNPYIQVVGYFLLQRLKQNQGAAEKILQEGKTIAKSLDDMRKVAEKKKVGSCAVLTDQEGFETVLKYYGINAPVPEPVLKEEPKKEEPKDDFNYSLDDFLK